MIAFRRYAGALLLVVGLAAGQEPEGVLIGAGDIALCGSQLQWAEATGDLVEKYPDAIVFTMGDNVYPGGTREEFRDCYDPTWGSFRDRTRPALGNHEYQNKEGSAPYFEYFGERAGSAEQSYYDYTVGGWHVIVLDTNCEPKYQKKGAPACGEDSEQYGWLREKLEQSTAECTLVYGHHPVFSSGKHGDTEHMRPMFRLLYDYGVEAYVAGHDHNYERFEPLDPNGARDVEHGVRQFIAGAGGRELRKMKNAQLYSAARNNITYGVLKLTLYTDHYDWEFVAVDPSKYSDSGSTVCHSRP